MNKKIAAVLMFLSLVAVVPAGGEEPTEYVIKPGDTLWGLSEKFLSDPYYWPNLWSKNPSITNPHFVYPGQKLRFYSDRIEIVPAETPAVTPPVEPSVKDPAPIQEPVKEAPVKEESRPVPRKTTKKVVQERREVTFTVSGGEGFVMEKQVKPVGFIVATHHNRQMVGEDDIVYTDIGRENGAKVGARFSIFKKKEAISHPKSNVIVGHKVQPLGTLQLTQVEDQSSRAIIMKSYQEIGPGCYLLPYKNKRKEISLKAATADLLGYIVATQTGNEGIGEGDIAYLDLGAKEGLEVGNFLYVTRDVVPDQKYLSAPVGKLPVDVIGALVVVETGERTSTVLVVKSIDTIYRGDRVELRKPR